MGVERNHRPLSFALLLAVLLAGCGQKGPLVLPERPAPKPAEASEAKPVATKPAAIQAEAEASEPEH